MKLPDRTFVTEPADVAAGHIAKPLWFSLFSPSNGGKTFTSLRLATGMQSVLGGDINLIDTESGRGIHYKDFFKYQYTPFVAPYGSLDYLVAINHAVTKGARVVIIDQLSYEHDGEGGMLDFHDKELDRMAGDDWKKREAVKMLAWTKPKAARKQLIRAMLATNVAFILCFRADETAKPVKNKETGKNEVLQMGFMPIAGKNFVYEATVSALLLPGAKGVPTWSPENVGERLMVKVPEQFKTLFRDGEQLNEEHGRRLAEWSRAGVSAPSTLSTQSPVASSKKPKSIEDRVAAYEQKLSKAQTPIEVETVWRLAADLRQEVDPETLDRMSLRYDARVSDFSEVAK